MVYNSAPKVPPSSAAMKSSRSPLLVKHQIGKNHPVLMASLLTDGRDTLVPNVKYSFTIGIHLTIPASLQVVACIERETIHRRKQTNGKPNPSRLVIMEEITDMNAVNVAVVVVSAGGASVRRNRCQRSHYDRWSFLVGCAENTTAIMPSHMLTLCRIDNVISVMAVITASEIF